MTVNRRQSIIGAVSVAIATLALPCAAKPYDPSFWEEHEYFLFFIEDIEKAIVKIGRATHVEQSNNVHVWAKLRNGTHEHVRAIHKALSWARLEHAIVEDVFDANAHPTREILWLGAELQRLERHEETYEIPSPEWFEDKIRDIYAAWRRE